MSKYTLNIGLDNPFTGEPNSIPKTLRLAFCHLVNVTNVAVKQSASERTVVIDCDDIDGNINVLAVALDQDCIAVLNNETGEGALYGDKAEAWAPFNRDSFLTI
jgi:regulatory protein YycH of two-component signal transduction system YycFG